MNGAIHRANQLQQVARFQLLLMSNLKPSPMPQKLPTVRELYLPALLPQVAAIAALALLLHLALSLGWNHSLLLGALIYLVFCRVMRAIFAKHHAAGIAAYQARRFEESVLHNQASLELFSRHTTLDNWRWLAFGFTNRNSLKTVALCNMAFSAAQLGQGARAIELYETALRLTPGCTLAETSLNMLRATNRSSAAGHD